MSVGPSSLGSACRTSRIYVLRAATRAYVYIIVKTLDPHLTGGNVIREVRLSCRHDSFHDCGWCDIPPCLRGFRHCSQLGAGVCEVHRRRPAAPAQEKVMKNGKISAILACPFQERRNKSSFRCQQSQGPEGKGDPRRSRSMGLHCEADALAPRRVSKRCPKHLSSEV